MTYDNPRIPKILDTLGRFCTRHPLMVVTIVLLAQCVFTLDARALWFSDEVRYANAFENLLNGHWLVLHLNGQMYPDKPPVYFWFMWLVSKLGGGATPVTFFASSALSALLYLFATHFMCRRIANEDNTTSLITGLFFLTSLYFIGLGQYLRMDLLFGVFILASQFFFYFGVNNEQNNAYNVLAFVLAGVATLTKGPLGAVFPLLGVIVFLAWKGDLRRLFRKDMLLGLVLMLLMLAAWVGGAYMIEGKAYIDNIFYKQIYRRAVNTWHHEEPFYYYLTALPLVCLPWTFIVVLLPFRRLGKAAFWKDLWERRRAAQGTTYLWVLFLTGFCMLSLLSGKVAIYLLPVLAPLAILGAKGLRRAAELHHGRLPWMWICVALFCFIMVLAAPFFEIFCPWPVTVAGLGFVTLIMGATGAAVLAVRRMGIGPALAVFVLGITLVLQPLKLMTLPSINTGMSPKAMAMVIRDYVSHGFSPAAYDIYSGIFTYYAGRDILESDYFEDMAKNFAEHPGKGIAVFKEKDWKRWDKKPEGLKVVFRQWIVDRPYVLVSNEASATPKD